MASDANTPFSRAGKRIPATENTFVLRTDFSSEHAWKSLCELLQNPDDEFAPDLDFISDPTFAGIALSEVPSLVSEKSDHAFVFVVDGPSLLRPGNPVVVLDLKEKPGRNFRVVASALAEVANNLSIANMDFEEFALAVDSDGIFRGFKQN